MTNGEKLLKIFPNMELNKKMHKGIQIDFDSDWWNAEYKESTTKNDLGLDRISKQELIDIVMDMYELVRKAVTKKDCNTCTHNNETDGSNCYECVKDMCNNYEPTTKNNLAVDDEERELALMYLEQMKEDYIEGVGYERHPLPEYYAIETAIKSLAMPSVTPQEPRKGYLSIDDVMSVFDDFRCGEVDEDGTETFLKMLKDKTDMREVEE